MPRFALLLLALAACRAPSDTFGPAAPTHERDTVVISNGTEPRSIDPGLASESSGIEVAQNCFEGLTVFDAKSPLKPAPGMAEKWEVEDGGRRYVFHLRAATWSDGSPVTARDFVWSWLRVLAPATASEYAYQLWYLKGAKSYNDGSSTDGALVGVTARDPRTLVVELEQPTPFFLFLTSFATYAPVPRKAVDAHGILWTRPGNIVVNGPYTVTRWRLQDEIVLEKNARYWDAAHVRIAKVVALSNDNDQSVMNLYRTGEVDTTAPNSVPPLSAVPSLRAFRDYSEYPFLASYWYWFNTRRPPFDKRDVRQAFAKAIDKKKLVETVLHRTPVASWSVVPDLFGEATGYHPPLGKDDRYDPAGARALLAKAGYPGGQGFPDVKLMFNPSDQHRLIAEALQAMWKEELGVTVAIPNVEWKVMLSEMQQGDFDLGRSGWQADYPEPSTFLTVFLGGGGQNEAGWSNAEYDRTLAEALREPDPARRNALYAQCERILLDELPVLPIYTYARNDLTAPKLGGLEPNLMGLHLYRNMFWK
jgi:oligopeptide transport system substrate-binding protein